MTCFVATADPVFDRELRVLAELSGLTVTENAADLLFLDMDAPAAAPACRKTVRFSYSDENRADFLRPVSYRAFMVFLKEEGEDAGESYFSFSFPVENTFTATEKRLLDALMQAQGNVVSTKDLARTVFGNEECHNELKVYIRHLRQKIEEPQGIRIIETVRGKGYRFRSDRIAKVPAVNTGDSV